MPRLMRFRYNRKAAEDACRKGLPLPAPESVEDLGVAEYDEGALMQVARIFYQRMKASEKQGTPSEATGTEG
ncbi:MAG: hypothetical protein GXW85_04750 [Clostridia bacterium]|nr:hypothetical protein [Clostridia bacterium]